MNSAALAERSDDGCFAANRETLITVLYWSIVAIDKNLLMQPKKVMDPSNPDRCYVKSLWPSRSRSMQACTLSQECSCSSTFSCSVDVSRGRYRW